MSLEPAATRTPDDRPGFLLDEFEGSRSVAARRAAMLPMLQTEMRRTHAARRSRRAMAAIGASVFAIALTIAVLEQRSQMPTAGTLVAQDQAPARASPVAIEIARTPAGVLERFAGVSGTVRVEVISDAKLLAELASIDRPAGLVRSGERMWVTGDVADHPNDAGSSNAS